MTPPAARPCGNSRVSRNSAAAHIVATQPRSFSTAVCHHKMAGIPNSSNSIPAKSPVSQQTQETKPGESTEMFSCLSLAPAPAVPIQRNWISPLQEIIRTTELALRILCLLILTSLACLVAFEGLSSKKTLTTGALPTKHTPPVMAFVDGTKHQTPGLNAAIYAPDGLPPIENRWRLSSVYLLESQGGNISNVPGS